MLKAEESEGSKVIACVTCGERRFFFTDAGVANFRLNHLGHMLSSEGEPHASTLKSALSDEEGKMKGSGRVKLERLVVDVSDSGNEDEREFILAGFIRGGDACFERNVPASETEVVLSALKNHELRGKEGDTFTWDDDAVDISDEAKTILQTKKAAIQTKKGGAKAGRVGVQEMEALSEKKLVGPQPGSTRNIEKKGGERILLSSSSYIKEGDAYEKEAARVSNVLRSFRWRIEPTYTIGVLFDDNLSIVTNTGLMSKGLIEKIEEMGYELVAISAEGGKPTAWFKRRVSQDHLAPKQQEKDEPMPEVEMAIQPGPDII